MYNNNNSPNALPPLLRPRTLLFLLTLLVVLSGKHAGHVQELANLILLRQEQGYYLPLSINHHAMRLSAHLQGGRSWIKEALCKVCDLGT